MRERKRLEAAGAEIAKSLHFSKILIPVLIGVGVVAYLLWSHFDPDEFRRIDWSLHTWGWVALAALLLVIRHLAYAWRIHILSEGFFSFRKCIQLIFIWEFSSAVTPTSAGGSAVALFVLSREKLPFARTATIVVQTVVLDSIFFIGFLPILYLIFGSSMIRPGNLDFFEVGGWGFTFLASYLVMAAYGGFFWYGLFRNPGQFKRLLVLCTYNRFLKRFRHQAIDTGNDIVMASRELARHPFSFHLRAFGATVLAWTCKFLVLSALINGIVPDIDLDLSDQALMFSRIMAMLVIMAFSPTPGGSGFAEFVFGGFLSDFVPKGIALVIATIWRLMAYYFYLFAGAVIIPAWLQSHVKINIRQRGKGQDSRHGQED